MMKKLMTVAFLFVVCCSTAPAVGKPNIVIVYADDMGHGDMSCQNPDAKLETANLDRLASEGMRFTDGHSSSGHCTPSRYALLTGNYHWRKGPRGDDIVHAFGPPYFEDGELTLPQMLKEQGYQTGMVGKWHLGWNWGELVKEGKTDLSPRQKSHAFKPDQLDWTKPVTGGPLDRGFDYYFGDGTINFPPYCWIENDKIVKAPTEMLDLKEMQTKEGRWEFRPGPMAEGWNPYEVLPTLTKKAVAFVNRQKADKPFFLYFALPAPHAPIIPNDEFDGKTEAGAYGDFVFQCDWVTGQVMEALKSKGLDENTIVIFSADNGPERYAYARIQNHEHYSMGSLRGLKRDTYEGGHRVPFIVKWPGKIKAGVVSDEVVNQVDIMATVAEVVGYKLPSDHAVDSYSLVKVLTGEKYEKPLREATIQHTKHGVFAVRQGDWVLIDGPTGQISAAPQWYYEKTGYSKPARSGGPLLFNLKEDLGERIDLAKDHPEKVEQMRAILKKYKAEGRSVAQR